MAQPYVRRHIHSQMAFPESSNVRLELCPPNEEQLHTMYSQHGTNEESLAVEVPRLQAWISQHSHLSVPPDSRLVVLCLLYCNNNVEDARKQLERYYNTRRAMREYFRDRDPASQELQQCAEIMCVGPLPRLAPQGRRIHVFHLLDSDYNKFYVENYIKWAFMIGDIRVFEDVTLDCVLIVDMRGFQMGHVTKLSVQHVRKYVYCSKHIFMTKVHEVHIINAPPFIDSLLNLFRPFVKDKVFGRIHIHSSGCSSLHQHFPSAALPQDYGGTLPLLKDIAGAWKRKVMAYRDWFLQQDSVLNDIKVMDSVDDDDMFGAQGSFHKLEVD